MKYKKSFKIIIVFVGLFALSSCNKEKAEAVQVAAEQFKIDAISAIDQTNFLFIQAFSDDIPSEEDQINKVIYIIKHIEKDKVNDNLLDKVSKSANSGQKALAATNEEFDKLRAQYREFEKMFSSLDKGSFFAKDAVKEAEKHAVNLTIQLINYAKILQGDFKFSSRRAEILTKMKAAKNDTIAALQQELIKNISIEFIQLLKDEKQYKERAIRQCYKAAESGKIVTDLIRNYDKMNVADILNTIKGSLDFAMEITNGNQNIADLTTKFEGVKKVIIEDPYYKQLLSQEIISGK